MAVCPQHGTLTHSAHELLAELSRHQFAHPHEPTRAAISHVCEGLGYGAPAVAAALNWLDVSAGSIVGRLRRTELVQLVCCVDRIARSGGIPPAPAPDHHDAAADPAAPPAQNA